MALTLLLIQLAVILLAARLCGVVMRLFGQPAVIGEMLAGILLGPVALGHLLPDVSASLFPKTGMSSLKVLSDIGLVLFMFLAGAEFQLPLMRKLGRAAVVISISSIVVPLVLGMSLGWALHPMLGTAVPRLHFALFIGAAMSVTAFPVLVRILEERGLKSTPLGALATGCAAVDDVTAWCMLAAITALVHGSAAAAGTATAGPAGYGMSLGGMVLGVVLFLVVMLAAVRPVLARMFAGRESQPLRTQDLACLLIIALLSAATGEALGVHALFGAFLAGCILPKHPDFCARVEERLKDMVTSLFMPVFFVISGMRTQLPFSFGEISGLDPLVTCLAAALLFVVAVAGKFGGSAIAARWCGLSWRDSAGIGILMNTRGLMELVFLNAGYDLGILPPPVFTLMVGMALITTCMTSPLMSWLMGESAATEEPRAKAPGAPVELETGA
ncbi:MAG: cation:proton antiporter [Candidatus Methylacidiphilales bacterium]